MGGRDCAFRGRACGEMFIGIVCVICCIFLEGEGEVCEKHGRVAFGTW